MTRGKGLARLRLNWIDDMRELPEWYTHRYRIDLKEIPARYRARHILEVHPYSPLLLRKEVEKFAYYFRREFDYDFVQFDSADSGKRGVLAAFTEWQSAM